MNPASFLFVRDAERLQSSRGSQYDWPISTDLKCWALLAKIPT